MFANNKRLKMTSDSSDDVPMQSDTSETDASVMAPSGSASVTIALHPLVIMNISEHYTRTRAQEEAKDTKGMIRSFKYWSIPFLATQVCGRSIYLSNNANFNKLKVIAYTKKNKGKKNREKSRKRNDVPP